MTVAACLIVRDGAATIAASIASVRPFVDEVCVYDTGSVDGTLELLDELADEPGTPLLVERGEWRNDFAWAREQSFAMASPQAEWLLWLDADDVIEGAQHLRRLAELAAEVEYVWIRRTITDWEPRATRPGACVWKWPIHEGLLPKRELACAAAVPGRISISHPPLDAAKHDAAVIAALAGPDVNPWWHVMAADTYRRRGDNAAAFTALRDYFAIAGAETIKTRRFAAWLMLAELTTERDGPAAGGAVLLERERELQAWLADGAAGRLPGHAGLIASGFFDRLNSGWRPQSAGRNAPCACGSGRKVKRCCGEDPVFVRPPKRL